MCGGEAWWVWSRIHTVDLRRHRGDVNFTSRVGACGLVTCCLCDAAAQAATPSLFSKLPNTDRFGPKGPFRITFIRKGHGEKRCAAWRRGSKRIPPYTSRPASNREEGAERPQRRSWRKEKGEKGERERPQRRGRRGSTAVAHPRLREREIFIDNLLVRVHLIIEMSRPALRHGNLNSLFQVALYLPS